MPLKVYDIPPYYDDFDQSKNYLRTLFRPGYAVQARELTQLQTALQAQIDRFGRHVFKDGSPVLGGQAALDRQFAYVKLESVFTYSSTTYYPEGDGGSIPPYYQSLIGTTLTGETSGVKAVVLDAVQSTLSDPLTAFVKYVSAGTDNLASVFAAEEVLVNDDPTPRRVKVKPAASTPTGLGSRVSVTEGVFFVSGCFVYSAPGSVILDKYGTTPSARVVFKIAESVVTSADDATLTDNALGTPNVAAPGANRYRVSLTLTTQPIDFANRSEDDIIQLLVIEEGRVREEARTQYSELGDILAQRTFEESGNYVVRPFQINIREYLNDGSNGGVYTSQQILDKNPTGSLTTLSEAATYGAARVAVGLEPSVAYVNGYRIETVDTKYVPVTKPRELAYFNGATTLASLGSYINVTNVVGLPDINTFLPINLKNTGGATIGTARGRSFISNGSATAKLYLFDISMNAGQTFADVRSLQSTLASGPAFTADCAVPTLYGTENNKLVFQLPVGTVETLRATGNLNDTFYYVVKKYDNRTTNGSGVVTVTATTGETFESTTVGDWMSVTTGGTVAYPDSVTLGGSPVGSSATLTFSAYPSTAMYITASSRRNLLEKSKIVHRDQNVAIASPNTTPGSADALGLSDVLKLTAIYMSPGLGTAATSSHTNVTSRYILDSGQRDNYYDAASIILRNDSPAPTGQLLVVLDYFTHGAGDYFSVDSYSGIDYGEIPVHHSSSGAISLSDALDFRPVKANSGADFTSSGSSLTSIVKPNSIITCDIQYYLPRVDKIYVGKGGSFDAVEGISSINPVPPEDVKDAMMLYTLRLPAYLFSPGDAIPVLIDNKRYTMRDIGKLEKRISKLEYYTSLSLLEQTTSSSQILDSVSGLQRYKNGFIVDSFLGSNIGAVTNPDYAAATDKSTGTLRPLFHEDAVRLVWNESASSNVRKTGPLVTLDYTETPYIQQPYASRTEYVNPFSVFSWGGTMTLSPSSDEWKETRRAPDVVIDQTGIYDALVSMVDRSGAIGTVWNEWQTNWTGVSQSSTTNGDIFRSSQFSFQSEITTTTTTTTTNQSRTGTVSSVVPDTVTANLGDRVVEVNFVPFIRSRKIYFRCRAMKPNTRVYPFFDGQDVSAWTRQESSFSEYTDGTDSSNYYGWTTHPAGSTNLVTNASGELIGSIVIPNTDALKFKTGQRILRVSDSTTNAADDTVTTWAEAQYTAQGILQTLENQVISTAVPTIQLTQVTDNRVLTDSSVESRITTTPIRRYIDPLAQTFICDTEGGVFLTSIDLYFQSKDDDLPVTIQLRTVQNGTPTAVVLPYSESTLLPASINVSTDASVPTRFTFQSPVHAIQGVEYALVLMSNSDRVKVWVSELGGYDVTNPAFRIVSQPYAGVFFESSNASTWTPDQTKDIKFKLNRALFNTAGGSLVVTENDIPAETLINDPVETTNSSATFRVYHRNHGLFAGSSQVTISGVAATSGSDMNGIPIAQINATHTVVDAEADSFTVTVASSASSTGRAGGSAVTSTPNRSYDSVCPILQQITLPGTSLDWSAALTSGKSLAGSEVPHIVSSPVQIKVNDNTFVARPGVIVGPPSRGLLSSGSRSFILTGSFASSKDNLSPVVDLTRASVVTVSNRIDNPAAASAAGFNAVHNYVGESIGVGNSALARYITRRVDLNDPATAIQIYLNVNVPPSASIEVWWKALPKGSDANFDQLPWTQAVSAGDVPITDDPSIYTEVSYPIEDAAIGYEFTSMAVKVVLKSNNSSTVPTCRDLRALAVT